MAHAVHLVRPMSFFLRASWMTACLLVACSAPTEQFTGDGEVVRTGKADGRATIPDVMTDLASTLSYRVLVFEVGFEPAMAYELIRRRTTDPLSDFDELLELVGVPVVNRLYEWSVFNGYVCDPSLGPCGPKARAQVLERFVGAVFQSTGLIHDFPDDPNVVLQRSLDRFFESPSQESYYAALWTVMDTFPAGHSSLFSRTQCGGGLVDATSSPFGVCGRPHPDGVIVTYAQDGNPLGLAAGDRIVRALGVAGADLLAAAYDTPRCGSVAASESHHAHLGSLALFSALSPGEEIEVLSPAGDRRTVGVPVPSYDPTEYVSCLDAFGRPPLDAEAEVTLRDDGVAVVRVPDFTPAESFAGNPGDRDAVDRFLGAYQESLAEAVQAAWSARAVVWDVRGNRGGISPVALAIVSGMPSARPMPVSTCTYRNLRTGGFEADPTANFAVDPESDAAQAFAFPAPTAVLADGLTISAADYFTFATRIATDTPIIGAPTAGAFGTGAAPPFDVDSDMAAVIDSYRCADSDGALLETRGVIPHQEVPYDPVELSRGVDSPLEAAVAAALGTTQ